MPDPWAAGGAEHTRLIFPAVMQVLSVSEPLPRTAFVRDWVFAAAMEGDAFLSALFGMSFENSANPFQLASGRLTPDQMLAKLRYLSLTRLAFWMNQPDNQAFVERVDGSVENFVNSVFGIYAMDAAHEDFIRSALEVMNDEAADDSQRMLRVGTSLVTKLMEIASGISLTGPPPFAVVGPVVLLHGRTAKVFGQTLRQRMEGR